MNSVQTLGSFLFILLTKLSQYFKLTPLIICETLPHEAEISMKWCSLLSMPRLLVCGGSKPIEKVVQTTLAIKLSTFASGLWWLANGENAEKVVLEFEGLKEFGGDIFMHACDYKYGKSYNGKRVLVVDCGNLGMEVPAASCRASRSHLHLHSCP
jgi:hypothetical protein